MKNGAIVANSGHFNVEIDLEALQTLARTVRKNVRVNVDQYVLRGGKSVYVLAEGRLVNLAAAEGHPASVMDMSFATQALMTEWCVKHRDALRVEVLNVPAEIEQSICRLKLKSMGVAIDTMTPEQLVYVQSWQEGT